MQLNTAERVISGPLVPHGDDVFIHSEERSAGSLSAAQITSLAAENAELRGQLEQLRGERARWTETQRRLMDLLHTQAPEKLVHDLRNLLNERDLLKTLVDQM